ncbi:hypothetical protein FHS42_003023 [Streptomyces zagrosensis]|uniref:Uncharacterized protein n=1 Tax=Streptomyces zagrosensis TaxID=1042984 RepID=A0A7W9UZP1_9ACTN|nr:hypothetical protein [Streptomyces zagrosensis]
MARTMPRMLQELSQEKGGELLGDRATVRLGC